MDDAKTHQALDAIADLFLTSAPGRGDSPADSPRVGSPSAVSGVRMPPKPSLAMSGVIWSDADQFTASPLPGALPPTYGKPSVAGSSPAVEPRQEVGDVAADAAVHGTGGVEAVFLASLPGLSGPWLTQYANYLLDHYQAVGLIRLDDQQFELQRVSRHPSHGDGLAGAAGVGVGGGGGGGGGPALRLVAHQPINDIERQLQSAGPVQTLLVQPVDTKHPHSVAQIMAANRWTILCGAYEAAVRDAQRVIGQLLELGPIPHRHRLGLMIMGCDAAKARQAAQAIHQGLSDRLTGPIDMVGHQMQMVPVNSRTLGVWEANDGNLALLQDYLETVASPAGATSPLGSIPAAATASLEHAARQTPGGHRSEPAREKPMPVDAATPGRAVSTSSRQREYREAFAAEPSAVTVAGAHEPSLAVSSSDGEEAALPVETAGEAHGSLASHLAQSLPGAMQLQARCPKHPAVELMLDQQGQVHLLASAQGAGDAASLRSVVVDLLETRRWVMEHRQLICLTQRQCRFDDAWAVELHLLTDQAPLAAGLAASLDGQLRVHLLQKVTVAGRSVTACADLN